MTVAECQTLLAQYIPVGQTFLTQLNQVRARLIQDGSWPGMMPRINLDIFQDADGNSIVTLPRQYIAILRGAIVPASGPLCVRSQLGTSGVFNETGYRYNTNFQEASDYFCVFREWTTPLKIRLKFEVTEAAGTIYLAGTDDGDDVWNSNSGTWEKREAVAYPNAAAPNTVTSTNTFDARGFKLVKPVTLGRVSAYTVTTDGVETLVAVYEPQETVPRWRRYKVAGSCGTEATWTYSAIVKLGYVPLVNSYEEVIPGNVGAIKFGLQALAAEDARHYPEAEGLWEMARDRLGREGESESEGAEDRIEISDDFQFQAIGRYW